MKVEGCTFDGIANIRCTKCGTIHNVSFDGGDLDTLDEAIERGAEEDGWEVYEAVCPNCFDSFSESAATFNEDECLEEEDVDYDAYDEEQLDDYDIDLNLDDEED
jgi:hypothetical protein